MPITTGNVPNLLSGVATGREQKRIAQPEKGLMVDKPRNFMQPGGRGTTVVKHPGSLRATAKREGLIKGDEKLSGKDLATLAKRGGPTTRRRVGLAKAFKEANHAHHDGKAGAF